MIGGFVGRPVECSTGPGRPMPTAARSPGRRSWVASSVADRPGHPGQHDLGPLRHLERLPGLGQHGAGEVGDHQRDVGRADVDAGHDAGVRVHREQRGRAAAGRGAAAGRHQPQRHQLVDPGGDRRAGQTGRLGELGAGPGTAVAQQLEEVTGLHGAHPTTLHPLPTRTNQLLPDSRQKPVTHATVPSWQIATRPTSRRRAPLSSPHTGPAPGGAPVPCCGPGG